MKGIKWKKYYGCVLGVVLCCLLNFGSVKNTDALELTVNVTPTGNSWETGTNLRCTEDVNGTINTITANRYGECSGFSSSTYYVYLRNMYRNGTIPVNKGYYYTFFIGYQTNGGLENVIWNMNTTSDWNIIEFNEITNDEMLTYCQSWLVNQSNNLEICQTVGGEWKSKYYRVTLQATETKDATVILGNTTGSPRSLMVLSSATPQLSMSSITEYKTTNDGADELNEKDDEDRSNLESQSSDTESGADDSANNISSGTTSLIGAISSFSTAMTNISAGNCTLPEISAYGISLGQLNLCTYSPPAWVQTALSVVVSLIAIRLAYAIFKRIIKIVKSFTGGS